MMWGSNWHFHKAKRSLGKLFCFFLTLPFFCLVYPCLMLQFSVPRTLQWWSLHCCVSLFLPSLLQVWYLCFHCTKVLPACSHQHSGVLKQSVLCMTDFQWLFWGTVNNIRLSVVTFICCYHRYHFLWFMGYWHYQMPAANCSKLSGVLDCGRWICLASNR